jgi:hypothetical protein
MRTQTKCTITLCCLFIVEILPLPFTALISLYVIRKRPSWFPTVAYNLYSDKPGSDLAKVKPPKLTAEQVMNTRRKCTITLSCMTFVDLLIPVTIPTALYIIRKRPQWFFDTATRLYADQLPELKNIIGPIIQLEDEEEKIVETPEMIEERERKFREIERKNLQFARTTLERI